MNDLPLVEVLFLLLLLSPNAFYLYLTRANHWGSLVHLHLWRHIFAFCMRLQYACCKAQVGFLSLDDLTISITQDQEYGGHLRQEDLGQASLRLYIPLNLLMWQYVHFFPLGIRLMSSWAKSILSAQYQTHVSYCDSSFRRIHQTPKAFCWTKLQCDS